MKSLTLALAVFVCGWCLRPCHAAEEALPKADTILDAYIAATGGHAAYEKAKTEVASGTLELAGKGLSGTITIYKGAPANSLTVMELPGVGKLEEGTDGEIAWSRSAVQGPRIKQGEERITALRAAKFYAEVNWRENYDKVETVGVEDVDGAPCYKVVMTPKEGGNPQTRWYDKNTHLLVKASLKVKTAMGEFLTESTFGDYQQSGGILSPRRIVQKVMGQEMVLKFQKIDYNVDIPKDRFDLPEEIRALVQKPAGQK